MNKYYTVIKLGLLVAIIGLIFSLCIPIILKPTPVVHPPIMEIDSTVFIIQNSSKNLDSI